MSHPNLEGWHELVRHQDPSGLGDLIAEDAVFFSPVVHAPQCAKALTQMYLGACCDR